MTIILNESENPDNPSVRLHTKEFIEGLLKAGSFISMIENKKINITSLFALLIERKDYQDFFTEITASNSFRDALMSLLYLYPSLVKSKITKTTIRKINAKLSDKSRKTSIQQTSSSI